MASPRSRGNKLRNRSDEDRPAGAVPATSATGPSSLVRARIRTISRERSSESLSNPLKTRSRGSPSSSSSSAHTNRNANGGGASSLSGTGSTSRTRTSPSTASSSPRSARGRSSIGSSGQSNSRSTHRSGASSSASGVSSASSPSSSLSNASSSLAMRAMLRAGERKGGAATSGGASSSPAFNSSGSLKRGPALPQDPGDERTLRRPPKRIGSNEVSEDVATGKAATSSSTANPSTLSSVAPALSPRSASASSSSSANISLSLSTNASSVGMGVAGSERHGQSSSASSSLPAPLLSDPSSSSPTLLSKSSTAPSPAPSTVIAASEGKSTALLIARAKEQAAELDRLKRLLGDRESKISRLKSELADVKGQLQAAELRAEFAEDMMNINDAPSAAPVVARESKKHGKSDLGSSQKRPSEDSTSTAATESETGDSVSDLPSSSRLSSSSRSSADRLNRRKSFMALNTRAEPLLSLAGVNDSTDGRTGPNSQASASALASAATSPVPSLLSMKSDAAASQSFASLSEMVSKLRQKGAKVLQTPRSSANSAAKAKEAATDSLSPTAEIDASGSTATAASTTIAASERPDSQRSNASDSSTSSWQAGRRSRASSHSDGSLTLGRARARALSIGAERSASSSSSVPTAAMEQPDPAFMAAIDSVLAADDDDDDDDNAADYNVHLKKADETAAALAHAVSATASVSENLTPASSDTDLSRTGGSRSSSSARIEVPKMSSGRWQEALARAETGRSTASSASSNDSHRNWQVAYGGGDLSGGRHRFGTVYLDGSAGAPEGMLVHAVDENTGERQIKAGTADRLVEQLAPEAEMVSQKFVSEFLTTYSNFMTGSELINELLVRWHAFDDAQSETSNTKAGQRAIVRMRLINVLKKWLEQRPKDFEEDASLLQRFVGVVRGPLAKESPQWAARIECEMQTHVARSAVVSLLRAEPREAVLAAMKRADAGLVHKGFSVHRGVRVFLGSEAIAWLCDNIAELGGSEDVAVELMQALVDDGLVAELKDKQKVVDDGEDGKSPDNDAKPKFQNRMVFYYFVQQATDEALGDEMGASMGGHGGAIRRFPDPLLPTAGRKISSCVDLEPLEVARQMTLMDRELFSAVDPIELQSRHLNAASSAYIAHFNRVCYLVATEIVTSGDSAEERCEVLRGFIRIGEHLERMRNYNGLFALIGGLHVSSVNRMRRMWALLREEHKEMNESLQRLIELTNPEHNYMPYRKQIAQDTESHLPCLPYFGQFLRDLTHIRDGNPDTLVADDEESGGGGGGGGRPATMLVNFEKMRLLARVSNSFAELQRNSSRYKFQAVPVIEKHLGESDVLSESDLYDISIRVEPRQSSTATAASSSGNLSDSSSSSVPSASSARAMATSELTSSNKKSGGKKSKEMNSHSSPRKKSSGSAIHRNSGGNGRSHKGVGVVASPSKQGGGGGPSPRKRRASLSHRVASIFKPSGVAKTERELKELEDQWKAMGIFADEDE